MVSSREMEPREAYTMYKSRCAVEDLFDTAKNILSADKMHMHDDAHVMGHLFITFVATQIRFELSRLIDDANLSSRYSPEDVLDIYSVMKVLTSDTEVRQVVPKDLRDLDARLKVFMYSTPEDLDKVNCVKKKRGRKPKASEPSS